jgi:DNA-binding MarR family transcriptional regulator
MTTSKKLSAASAAASAAAKPMGLAYLVGRLDHVLNQRLRDSLAPAGLSVPQYTALSVFRAHGSLSNAPLATRTMISPQSANEMVKQMEAKGWIARTPDPAHGRIIQISLTASGEAVLGECDAKVAEVERTMFPELDEAGRVEMLGQLRGAVRALSMQGI